MRVPVFRLLLSTFLLVSCSDDAKTPTLQEGDDCSSTVLSGGQGDASSGVCAVGLSCVNNICTAGSSTNNATNNKTNNSTGSSNNATPTCTDGELNQDESAIDCGGATCDACADGMGCSTGTDCTSGVCLDDMCAPASCGDGIINADETCDGDGAGTGGSTATCDIDCSAVECGDGLANTEAGETCDGDGLGSGGETADCNTDCSANSCGDGKLNTTAGETCDGDNAGTGGETNLCDTDCSAAECGDALVNTLAGEGCDDGNQIDDDACSNTCVGASCGDGVVNNGEACDDGNQVDDDTCNNACVLNVCGDGTVNNGEACDDGNQVDDDACSNTCVLNVCGDGTVNNGEACDDGNQVDDDTCNNACVLNVCGDGTVNNGEACDDGNQVDDDTCNNACVLNVCGDGTVNNGEACDDGNQVDDDGCSNTCSLPVRRTVALCGTSQRPVTQFVPARFTIVNTCVPSNNMQAMLISRSGLPGFATNSAAIQTYVQNGGKLLTEFKGSDEVFNGIFPETVVEGPRNGSCLDVMPTVVQFSPGDPFWADNTFNTIPSNQTGCGYSVSAFPGITPIAGWSASAVSVAYRDFGAGRVWFTDFDWQDTGSSTAATFADSAKLLGYMIDPVRRNVALCGTSQRPVTEFVPARFTIVNTCVPSDDMQAMLISRSGLAGFATNSAAIQTYVQNGGKLLTEFKGSDEVFNGIFPETVVEGPRNGGCQDNMPTAVQFSPGDAFWANNTFNTIPSNQTGCGYSVSAYPGITPIAGWSAAAVSVAYRDFGAGRVWLTDFDWQDTDITTAAFADSAALLGSMINP